MVLKYLSRKFIVFAIATLLLIFKRLDATTWLYVALAYLGTNVVAKLLRGGDNENMENN
jgi:hypothetical protein